MILGKSSRRDSGSSEGTIRSMRHWMLYNIAIKLKNCVLVADLQGLLETT